MLIGACDPMPCPIHVFRLSREKQIRDGGASIGGSGGTLSLSLVLSFFLSLSFDLSFWISLVHSFSHSGFPFFLFRSFSLFHFNFI